MITEQYISAARRRQTTRGHFSSDNPDAIFTIEDICGFTGLTKQGAGARLRLLGIHGAIADEHLASGGLMYFYTIEEAEQIINFTKRPKQASSKEKKVPAWTARQIADILKVKVGLIHNRIQRLHIKGKLIETDDIRHKYVAAYNIEQIRKIAEYKSDKHKYISIDLEQTPWSLHELCQYYWPIESQFPIQDDPHEWDEMDTEIMEEYQKDLIAAQYQKKHGDKENDRTNILADDTSKRKL